MMNTTTVLPVGEELKGKLINDIKEEETMTNTTTATNTNTTKGATNMKNTINTKAQEARNTLSKYMDAVKSFGYKSALTNMLLKTAKFAGKVLKSSVSLCKGIYDWSNNTKTGRLTAGILDMGAVMTLAGLFTHGVLAAAATAFVFSTAVICIQNTVFGNEYSIKSVILKQAAYAISIALFVQFAIPFLMPLAITAWAYVSTLAFNAPLWTYALIMG